MKDIKENWGIWIWNILSFPSDVLFPLGLVIWIIQYLALDDLIAYRANVFPLEGDGGPKVAIGRIIAFFVHPFRFYLYNLLILGYLIISIYLFLRKKR